MKKDNLYFEAMKARDYRFDGKFFVGVKTTGIYCRPICPAKPKRENVEFFANYLEAEEAGYRPCLRCRPESAPQSPVWIGKTAVVKRAIKRLSDLDTLNFDEDQFADLFGVTARHLRRLFIEEVGKTPKQLSSEKRLNLARKLIVETRLSFSEVAFAAGFKSIRRFNDAFKDRFKKSPSEIRRSPLEASDHTIKVSLPYRPPFDFEGLMHFYQTHRIGNLEWFENNRMHRVIEFKGKLGEITISNDSANSRLLVEINFPDPAAIHSIISRVRSLFDLDSDPVLIANSLEVDSKMKAIIKKHPGIRLPSGWDPFEIALSSILGQFVSVDQGRALLASVVETVGRDSGIERDGQRVKLFPTPKQLAKADLTFLKTTTARKKTVTEFARAVLEKRISLEPTQNVEEFIAQALKLPGIGPWTASYMAMKVLRHTDAFPETDLILARALELHPKELVDQMSPWRGYAAALFWREYAQTLKNTKKKENKK